MSLSRIIYVILFFVTCWSAYYLLENERKADIQVAPNLELPMFSGETLSNTSYDADGLRNYVITSHHLDYYSKSGNTIFEKPVLKVYQDGKLQEWEITAEKGILASNNELTLYDNVLARCLLKDSGLQSVTTAKLSIQLKTRDFWTDTTVVLKGLQFETNGQAMEGNFAERSADFLTMYRVVKISHLSLVACLLASQSAFALKTDSQQPVYIDSDSQQLDLKSNRVTFIGNVTLKQGSINIHAHRLIVIRDAKSGQIQEIQGFGNLATFSQLTDEGKTLYGEAKKLNYQMAQDQLTMTDQAMLSQDESIIRSTKIRYHISAQKLIADGNPHERVSTVLQPQAANQ